jgi:hypothetical protein
MLGSARCHKIRVALPSALSSSCDLRSCPPLTENPCAATTCKMWPELIQHEISFGNLDKLETCDLCKIWGLRDCDYEEWRLLGYKTPVRTSQETHYVSATASSQLMLCKIWGLRGCDYVEWRLLEYKTPVRTSQETHYLSTTESSQLMLCKIWGFHDCDYEECCLVGYRTSSYPTGDTLRLRYRAQPVNAM